MILRAKSPHIRAGLSLLETTAAMTIGSIALAAMAVSVDALTHGPIKLASRAQAREQGELILDKMAREFAAAKIITSVIDTDVHQRIEFTIPENPTSGTNLKICKYEWEGSGTPLRFSIVNQYLNPSQDINGDGELDSWDGTYYDYIPNCLLFKMSYEYRARCATTDPSVVPFTGAISGPANLYAVFTNTIGGCSEFDVHVKAIHIELKVRSESGQDFTLYRTVSCRARPRLLAYWDQEPPVQ